MSQEESKKEGSDSDGADVVITTIEIKEEQPEVPKISGIAVDENLIKKRGFLITLSHNPPPEILLNQTLAEINEKYKEILSEFKEHQLKRQECLKNELQLCEAQHTALNDKQAAYAAYLDSLKTEEVELQTKLSKLHESVAEAIKKLGAAKETVVSKGLADMKLELEKAMEINSGLQQGQNVELEKRYVKDRPTFQEKIDFWKIILGKHQDHYQQVSERLKLMSRDGINAQIAQFLIYLGGISALVSGWWFSLWTGPNPAQNAVNNVTGNTNVRFFFLDNIGKFLAGYSPWVMTLIVLGYIVCIGLISYLCHILLVRFGFVIDVRELRKKRDKNATENQDDYDFDIEEQENLLRAKIKSTAWWGLWLKLTPILLAVVPVIGVISAELAKQKGGTNFQGLFDSLINEFIGTSIAIMFSAFSILLLTRVSENKYYKKNQHADGPEERPGLNVQYIGFVFFGLMILAMLLYHYPIVIFDDLRRVATFGFIVSCLATGFSLAYGYIFSGLKNNSDMLLFYIDTITTIIHHLSKPYQVNYTTNWSLKARIYRLQQKMFDLIEGRATLAADIAYGKEAPNAKGPVMMVRSQQETPTAENTAGDKKEKKNQQKGDKGDASAAQKKQPVLRRWFSWLIPKKYKREGSSDEYLDELAVSHTDLIYFPEIATTLKELHHQMQELRDRINKIQEERENRLRNLGVWHSINDQIANNRSRIDKANVKLTDYNIGCLAEEVMIGDMEKKEKTLLTEGYYTGLWFKDIDPGQRFNIGPAINHATPANA